jgi:hypothetical protein
MNTDSRQTIHIGINFVFSPLPAIDAQSKVRFQQSLLNSGIDFARTDSSKEREVFVLRETPTRLEIRVVAMPGAPVGQLLVVSPDPKTELELFAKDAEAIVEAFEATWPAQNRQIISTDVTIRDLYEATGEHAFKELWEKRLKQAPTSLARLGHPVLGGGLRFVMPPRAEDPEPAQIEVKIESFLQDTKKMFVETQFVWPSPKAPGAPFEIKERLHQVDRYVEDNVELFIVGGNE